MRVALYFARAYPGACALVFACLGIAAVSEGVGLGSLLPLLSIATDATRETSAFEESIRDLFGQLGIPVALPSLLTIVVAALWAKAAVVWFAKRRVGVTVARIATDLRLQLLRALLSARWDHGARQPTGRTANAIATEADRASYAFEYLALVATYSIEATLYLALACAVSWQGTLVAILAAAGLFAALSTWVRAAARAGRAQTSKADALLVRLCDTLGATKWMKATGREDLAQPLLEDETRALQRELQRRVVAKETLRALQEPMLGTLLAVGLLGALRVLALPLADTLLLGLLVIRALRKGSAVQSKLQSMAIEASALFAIDARIREAEAARERWTGSRAPAFEREVAFRGVSVARGERAVLRGLDLTIPAGEITAVVGASGEGKTTLVDLLTGLVRPDAGGLFVDGVDLAEVSLDDWRRQIGLVSQEAPMLHDSVRRNVSWGDPGIADSAIEAALRAAGAWDFVEALPGGLDTSVGERGALLSGGQRQRLAIARALVTRPRLLVLDEATSALDPQSEAELWATVARLRGDVTVLAISHRPALERIADSVFRLSSGRAERLAMPGRAVA